MNVLLLSSSVYSVIGVVHMAIVPVRRVYDDWERDPDGWSWTAYSTLYFVLLTLLWPMVYIRMAWRWIKLWISR